MAQAALAARNARYRGMATRSMMEDDASVNGALGFSDERRGNAIERLGQAAGKSVAKSLPRVVQKVRCFLRAFGLRLYSCKVQGSRSEVQKVIQICRSGYALRGAV